jgi:hypothetical protein
LPMTRRSITRLKEMEGSSTPATTPLRPLAGVRSKWLEGGE